MCIRDSTWYEFDMVPGEHEIRTCGPDVTGKVCVIGSQLKEHEDVYKRQVYLLPI